MAHPDITAVTQAEGQSGLAWGHRWVETGRFMKQVLGRTNRLDMGVRKGNKADSPCSTLLNG